MPGSPLDHSYAREIERIKADYFARRENIRKELAFKLKFNEEVRKKRRDSTSESNLSFFSRIWQYNKIEKDYDEEWDRIAVNFKRNCDENRRISSEAIERARQRPPQYTEENLPPYEE